MFDLPRSSIAEISVPANPGMNFAHVIGEVERMLARRLCPDYRLTLNRSDLAILDFATTRIVISHSDHPEGGHLADGGICILLCVGDPPDPATDGLRWVPHDFLCAKIAQRICERYSATIVSLRPVFDTIHEDMVDEIFSGLPQREEERRTDRPGNIRTPYWENPRKSGFGASGSGSSRQGRDLLRLHAVHDAFVKNSDPSPDGDVAAQATSIPLRLSATAMDITMLVTCLPLGAAMLAHHILHGGEMRRTAQMMTCAGLFLAVAESFGMGQVFALV